MQKTAWLIRIVRPHKRRCTKGVYNPMEKKTTSQQRSEVIEGFINIEWLMNAIICQRYFKKMTVKFVFDVLYDPYFSFGLRRNVLLKVYPSFQRDKIEDLNRLNNIRNYFGHCNQEFFRGPVIPPSGTKGVVPDPKSPSRDIDFDKLYAEFKEKEGPMTTYLATVYKELGGELEKA